MTEWLDAAAGLGIGVLLGAAVATALLLWRRSAILARLHNARTRAELLGQQAQERAGRIGRLEADLKQAHERRETAERSAAGLQEKVRAYEAAESRLKETFRAAGSEALSSNSRQFLELARETFQRLLAESRGDLDKRRAAIEAIVEPIRELLKRHGDAVSAIEQKRGRAYAGLEEQIRALAGAQQRLNEETGRLVSALRRPTHRGRWGEVQLHNVVELGGMIEHCDFHTQPSTDDPATQDRPDMTINLPGGGVIVVDAKVALDAYLDSLHPDGDRDAALARHAEHVETHVRRLAGRAYWKQFERTPRLVVMFMPLESALLAALELKPDLHARAMKDHVLIATPTLLVALLRAIAYGWQQEAVAANARAISRVGRQLYDRLAGFVEHLEDLGRSLGQSVRSYNKAIGSLEHRVLPSSRKLKELHATAEKPVDPPESLEVETRPVSSPELKRR